MKKLLALTLVGGLLGLTTGCPSSSSGTKGPVSTHSGPATHPSERPPMPPKDDTKPTPPKDDTKPVTPPKDDKGTKPEDKPGTPDKDKNKDKK